MISTCQPAEFGRLARGSWPSFTDTDKVVHAVRAQFPKLALALGDAELEVLLGACLAYSTDTHAVLDVLAQPQRYPRWCFELAELDLARFDVLHAPTAIPLARTEVSLNRALQLVPSARVALTTSADELWYAIHYGEPRVIPSPLQRRRTVLVWRAHGIGVCDRVMMPHEAAALDLAEHGTSIVELATKLGGEQAHTRARELVLAWCDEGLLR